MLSQIWNWPEQQRTRVWGRFKKPTATLGCHPPSGASWDFTLQLSGCWWRCGQNSKTTTTTEHQLFETEMDNVFLIKRLFYPHKTFSNTTLQPVLTHISLLSLLDIFIHNENRILRWQTITTCSYMAGGWRSVLCANIPAPDCRCRFASSATLRWALLSTLPV